MRQSENIKIKLITMINKDEFSWHYDKQRQVYNFISEVFVFSVYLLCFQIFAVKINFMDRNGSDLCNFYSKLDCW